MSNPPVSGSAGTADAALTPAALGLDGVPGGPQRRGFLTVLILAWFGGTLVLGTLAAAAMPKVLAFHHAETKDSAIALIAGIGGVVVIVVTPLVGRLSDRSTSRWGTRRPWMVGGVLVGTVGVIVLAFTQDVWTMVLGWSIVQAGYASLSMAQHALLADQIPARTRARVSAALSIANGMAVIGGAALVAAMPNDRQPLWFLVAGGIGGVLCLALAAGLRDIVRTTPAPPLQVRDVLASYWLDVRTHRDFGWAWVCRLLVTMALISVQLYLLFYIIDVLGVPKESASATLAQSYFAYLLAGFVTAVVFGWLSDRTGRRKMIILVSCLLTSVGLFAAYESRTFPLFLAAIAFVGAGQGAFASVDVALMTEVLPTYEEAGKDLGLVSLSYQVPQVLAPLSAAWVLSLGGGADNYRALFLWAMALSVLGGLAVLPVRSVR